MKPVAFEYARPGDIAAVLALISGAGGTVKIMAGNQSLGPMLNLRLVQPDLVVDITAVDQLREVENGGDALVVGACVTHADIEDLRVPDVTAGAMPAVARGIAYRAVRNRGTIGGSLCHADPAADWHAILAAVGAGVVLAGPAGERTLAVEDYMLGALEVDLQHGEMLRAVTVPKLGRGARWGYYKSCRKTGEFADAIGAFVSDPARGVCRAVVSSASRRPIVIDDATAILGGAEGREFQRAAVAAAIAAAGVTDPLDVQVHTAVLRRAFERAGRQ